MAAVARLCFSHLPVRPAPLSSARVLAELEGGALRAASCTRRHILAVGEGVQRLLTADAAVFVVRANVALAVVLIVLGRVLEAALRRNRNRVPLKLDLGRVFVFAAAQALDELPGKAINDLGTRLRNLMLHVAWQ